MKNTKMIFQNLNPDFLLINKDNKMEKKNMNNLIYNDNGEWVFNMKTCTNVNDDSPYKFLDTESHAYLIVPIQLVKELHLEDGISQFSYTNGVEVWLEEDCDAVLFMKAYVEYFRKPFEYGNDFASYTEWEELKTDCLESYSSFIADQKLIDSPFFNYVWKSDKLINQDAINNLSNDQLEQVNAILDKVN